MKLVFDNEIPIYRQLSSILGEQIRSGEYPPGAQIASEAMLCEQYGISRVTVRKAISQLVDEHLLVRRHGKGTFVSSMTFVESPSAQGSFTVSCRQMGVTPGTHIVEKTELPADGELARELCVPGGSRLVRIKRLRLADGVPTIFETDYIPAEPHAYLMIEDLEDASLLETIRKKTGLSASGYEDVIDIRYAGRENAKWLKCPEGQALLGIRQKVFSEHGAVLYINEQLICSDRYKYVTAR